jgi:hypothetical protein
VLPRDRQSAQVHSAVAQVIISFGTFPDRPCRADSALGGGFRVTKTIGAVHKHRTETKSTVNTTIFDFDYMKKNFASEIAFLFDQIIKTI